MLLHEQAQHGMTYHSIVSRPYAVPWYATPCIYAALCCAARAGRGAARAGGQARRAGGCGGAPVRPARVEPRALLVTPARAAC
jgi:hypothetical protein